ncbi:MAG: endonuclease/exonuclease/phosphatase family protein [Deltaproteobacteria bacterium]|nr:endonuclease/exonuclease/phosphatase family protein [Deltaproteobacteria bacterium]
MRSVRVVTLNLWNDRPDPVRRIEVAADGLRALQPDIVALQEVVGDGGSIENQAAQLAKALDATHHFDPVDSRKNGGPVGNAIVTRFPVLRALSVALPSGDDDLRRALFCELATPVGRLPVFTCHLSWEMWLSPRREAQVVAVDAFVHGHPGELPAILAGDFNASPDTAAIRFLTGRTSILGKGTYYRDCFARRRPDSHGYTWSDRNPYTVRWIERNRRLDYVFVGPIREDGWGAVLDARVVLDVPGPDGVYASDHFGVYAEIGQAPMEEAV